MLLITVLIFFATVASSSPYFTNTTSSRQFSTSSTANVPSSLSSLRSSSVSILSNSSSNYSPPISSSASTSLDFHNISKISSSNVKPTTSINPDDRLFTGSNHSTTSLGNLSVYYNPLLYGNPYYFIGLANPTGLNATQLVSCGNIWQTSFQDWQQTAPFTTGPAASGYTSIVTQFRYYPASATTKTFIDSGSVSWDTLLSGVGKFEVATISAIATAHGS